MKIQSGREARLPYSLSRWTDLPAAKWGWFAAQLDEGHMMAFDPRTAVPSRWSLLPEDVFGLIFWTRQPRNLIDNAERLKAYPLVIHFTLTGWHEVEYGAPNLNEGLLLLAETVGTFGADKVVWRFSPVPAVADVVERFQVIAERALEMGLRHVYVSFLQDNDLVPEPRSRRLREEQLKLMAARVPDMEIRICRENAPTGGGRPENLRLGICENGERFRPHRQFRWETDTERRLMWDSSPTEQCGCILAVDPFTINEACCYGCAYCYAADKGLNPRKRNTT